MPTTARGSEAKPEVAWGEHGVQLATLSDAWRFAQAAMRSGFLPDGFKTPESVVVALQAGSELGLTPWQSIQSIVPIKGTPTIRVETACALVEGAGLLEPGTKIRHAYDGEGDKLRCIVSSVPRGSRDPVESDFSMADAKAARLADKDNWRTYPKRMLLARAKGFHIRDYYPTAVRRMPTAEEMESIGAPQRKTLREVGPAAESTPTPDPLFEIEEKEVQT